MRKVRGQLPEPHPEDETFIIDSKSALLQKKTYLASSILYIVLAFILVGLIWAYFGPIEQITIGDGKVIPSSQVKIIQSLDGGIVVAIPVQEGEIVQKNQILVRLDDTRYTADYREGYAKYLALQAMVARLTAEAYNESQITFPPNLAQEQPELATRETRLFQTRKTALKEEIATLQHNAQLAEEEIKMYEPLVANGVVAKIDLLRAQRSLDEIKSSVLEKNNRFRESAWTDLNQKKAELATLEESLKSLNDRMVRTTLRSPVYGIVKKLHVVTIGGTITPGMAIMEIVPLEDTLLVQARVNPKDIAFVHVGQSTTVRITAYDYTVYGSLHGTVEYISADAIEDTKTLDKTPNSYYLVNVRTVRNYLGSEKHKLAIIPGMTATIHIVTGQKTVLDYILKPLIKAKEEALRER